MAWEQETREMLRLVPSEFTARALEGTENHATKHNYTIITAEVVKRYRKVLGF
jgi:hypothetical protein